MFNRSKKLQRDTAIIKVIKDREIDREGGGVIRSDYNKERTYKQINKLYYIDIEGEAI